MITALAKYRAPTIDRLLHSGANDLFRL